MKSPRAELVAETALTLLAERGMRGLTHRAVDEAAALPPGSASNVARTRAALLALALERLNELEERQFAAAGPLPERPGRHVLIEAVARLLHAQLTEDRRRTLARYELALEATRRPELRTLYDESGRRFRNLAIALMTAAGSSAPDRHGRQLVMFCEGVMFYVLAGAGTEPTLEELRLAVADFFTGVLGPSRDTPGTARH
ncbi:MULTISPECIES: TetR/AcrR family transcriptional regulator [Thermomonospora]|uniref:TetR family transcriptional regulator n=1 Tax=Thermomonospora curvata (strain ATCC 19995 / DSM 43183 / JCM 3096 / KCTC 9072 / NBRC 15933 / NCIMB 10081 / Henssen B9) TaxID=471852 RepID=D1ADB6_THECD|nr:MULTISPECIES: ABC-F family ATP-binding cassette domain-containing protein [Thermomonospora]ACY95626.1 TetR family transcriptional regulator [Thermomonospora curvata DSM 43183]PKK16226.1 MAG: TetR family transcriptional regulator [Thermomonospora sp. CIF 1]